MAQDRGGLEEGPVGRVEGVEARRDQRVQGLGHRQVGQVADRPVDAVGGLQRALGDEHPDDLDGVERDPVGAGDDPRGGVVGQAGHEAGEELAHRRRA